MHAPLHKPSRQNEPSATEAKRQLAIRIQVVPPTTTPLCPIVWSCSLWVRLVAFWRLTQIIAWKGRTKDEMEREWDWRRRQSLNQQFHALTASDDWKRKREKKCMQVVMHSVLEYWEWSQDSPPSQLWFHPGSWSSRKGSPLAAKGELSILQI